ncbi:hypothetical protein DFS34DRAFT_597805 [Phlyctochytrium arcticum]|nr:hypothetical protein DFS34DRAFT_598520 [Phlyctochytrium arcticum]KAI9090006.1 hypothetical protein DFS34DRAFT_597805 [Phlyctochytrium arcticum]
MEPHTQNVVARFQNELHQIDHATHPARVDAENFGIARPSAAWTWPGLNPCCLAGVDFQHAVGEGEVSKEWEHFSQALTTKFELQFWKKFDKEYRAFAVRKMNRISQPQISGWNYWRFGQTHENKLTFIARSIGIVRKFIANEPSLKEYWECWLAHRTRVEILMRHHLDAGLLDTLYQLTIKGIKLGMRLYGENFLSINSHYSVHFAEHILRFGCPREFCTFGFESLISKFSMGRIRNTNHHSLAKSALDNHWLFLTLDMMFNPEQGIFEQDDWTGKSSSLTAPANATFLSLIAHRLGDVCEDSSVYDEFRLNWVDYREGDIIAYVRHSSEEVEVNYQNALFGIVCRGIRSPYQNFVVVRTLPGPTVDALTMLPLIQLRPGSFTVLEATRIRGRAEICKIDVDQTDENEDGEAELVVRIRGL